MPNEDVFTRAAVFEPGTYDAGKRTIECVFTTGADVQRRDWEGEFVERLEVSAEAIDLTGLRGAPVLDTHDRWSVRSILGTVENAAVSGGRGVATVRFGERPEIAGIVQDIAGGVIRSVSAGYTVSRWEISKRADGMRVKTAKSWKPVEISFAPLAADPAARTRSVDERGHMDLQTQLRNIADAAGVPAAFADELATRSVTLDAGRMAIIQEAARRIPPIDTRVLPGRDAGEDLIPRMADGLRARFNRSHKPGDGGREFAALTVADLARRCLELRGASSFGLPADVISRAMQTTSDFPALLAETFNKELLELRSAPAPILQVFRHATATDFRARHVLEVSEGEALELVGEAGEVHNAVIKDAPLASYKLGTYGKIYAISFQALVNDDMGVLSDLSGRIVRGARQWLATYLTAVIASNPLLADGKGVFHIDHKNLAATPGKPDDDTIAEGKYAMRVQVDLSGNPVNSTPRYIVAPAALESDIDKLLAALYPAQPTEAAPAARTLTPIIEPRLDAVAPTAWYLFADPALAPVFEYAELSGYEGPQVEVQQGFRTVGTEMRILWHLGAGAIDSRGAYKNAGVP